MRADPATPMVPAPTIVPKSHWCSCGRSPQYHHESVHVTHALRAFANKNSIQLQNLTNQITQNSRLNWIILENACSGSPEGSFVCHRACCFRSKLSTKYIHFYS